MKNKFTKENVVQLIQEADLQQNQHLILLTKLFDLPSDNLQSILPQENLLNLLEFCSVTPTNQECIQKLYHQFKERKIVAPHKFIKQLDYSKEESLQFLKFTTPLIAFLEDGSLKLLSDTVRKLLSKTFISTHESAQIQSFATKWIEGLNKVMENSTLNALLTKVSNDGADVIISHHSCIDGVAGICRDYSILIYSDSLNDINSALVTLVHEFTHNLCNYLYRNDGLPYSQKDNSFGLISSAMFKEVQEEQSLYGQLYINKWQQLNLPLGVVVPEEELHTLPRDSWLSYMTLAYDKELYACEILPCFTGQMTHVILTNTNKDFTGNCSKEFVTTIFQYLHKQLLGSSFIPEVGNLFYNSSFVGPFAPVKQETILTTKAKKMIATQVADLSWLYLPEGQLAFQALPIFAKEIFYNKLFSLPELELHDMLDKHYTQIMLLSSDKYQHKITDAVTEIVPKWKPTIINERDNQSANNYNIVKYVTLGTAILAGVYIIYRKFFSDDCTVETSLDDLSLIGDTILIQDEL